jgi:phage tail tape-measure protein
VLGIVAWMSDRFLVRAVALARAGFGAVLTLRTAPVLRAMVRNEEPTGSLFLFARTLGIRDLVLGAGTFIASFDDGPADLRRWVRTCLASDAADAIAGATAARHIGVAGSATATLASLPFVAAGWRSLRNLGDEA